MLERYQIKRKISHKAGRSTYVAHDSETGEQVVIKILEFNDLFSWDDFKLFEREAQILQNLSHPNIPNYLDYFEISESDHQGFALVQTCIDAPSLAELIERGIKFSETEIIQLAEKLLDILDYLHGLNPPVIHRDIKPSNILLTNRSGNSIGDVYLVDFGSGQTVAKKEAGSITIVGSYGYIPLEQFMGQTTFASDLYSLGMTLIYLAAGIHPGDLTQVKGKVQFKNKEISRNFSLWLEKITDSYVENRYQSANIALTALQSGDNTNGNFIHLKPKNSQINWEHPILEEKQKK
ncbi:MAG: serine/threonine-protein kinase [Cyanobacteria bacterium P01_G01_bin.39]